MALDLIIFDLDGTLVDSLDDLTVSVNVMRESFAAAPLSRDQVQAMVGQGARTLVERALPGRAAREIDRALALFLAHNEAHLAVHTRPYPGIPELLVQLRRAGTQLVVVSNKNATLCRQLLAELQLADHFAAIYGADSFAERKPSPLPFQEVLRRLAIPAAQSLVVGDSANDLLAAQAAGIPMVGCGYGYGTAEELRTATRLAASVAELTAILMERVSC